VVVHVAEREWDFVRDQVAVDLEIIARQLQDGKINTQSAINDLFAFAKVLKEASEILPEQEKYFGYLAQPRQLWLWSYQVVMVIRALEVYRRWLRERLRAKSTWFHTIRCSECRKGERECLEIHELDVEEDYAKEFQGELIDLIAERTR
jgi:hypothetical protein